MATPSAHVLDLSAVAAAEAFAAACNAAALDTTAAYHAIWGIDDGNDYGRYFAGQDPLVAYLPYATALTAMTGQSVALRAAVATAGAALVTAAADITLIGAAATAVCEALRAACASPADAIRLLLGLAAFSDAPAAGTGDDAIGTQIAAITGLAVALFRRAAIISAARAAATYTPTSQQDAFAMTEAIGDAFDPIIDQAADAFDDASATALGALRVAVVTDLAARGGATPAVETVTLGTPLPAAVVAYRLYQDATRAGDLLARNNPPHPSFMPVTIEALEPAP